MIFFGWCVCLFRLSRMLCSLGRVLHLAVHLFGGAFSLQIHTQFVRFVKHPSFLYSKPLNSRLNVFLLFRTNWNGALSIHLPSGNSEIHCYVEKVIANQIAIKFTKNILHSTRLNANHVHKLNLKKNHIQFNWVFLSAFLCVFLFLLKMTHIYF